MSAIVIDFPKSDAFTAFDYPGGESQVRINKDYLEPLRLADEMVIVARIRSAADVLRLLLLSDALHAWNFKPQTLRLSYLPYGRADRRFVYGDCAGLQMFGKMLGLGHFEKIVTLDVHSPRAFDYFPQLVNESPMPFIVKAMDEIERQYGAGTILLPDEGAATRYPDGFRWPTLNCWKVRDAATGKLTGFQVPSAELLGSGPILIVDDICDGGGTFLGIAEKLSTKNPLFLYVTHGMFSKGREALDRVFTKIFTAGEF